MTTKTNSNSVLGKNSDVMAFLLSGEGDAVDRLARRAVQIILATNMPQTGEEVDTDPFVANMYASDALVSLSENIKHYPFVRANRDSFGGFEVGDLMSSADSDVLATATELIERAEALLPALSTAPSFNERDAALELDLLDAMIDPAFMEILDGIYERLLIQDVLERVAQDIPEGFDGVVVVII